MHKLPAFLFAFSLTCPGALALQTASSTNVAIAATTTRLSPAEQHIAAAKQQIASDPRRTQAYNDLALADIRRARETADPAYYADAELALKNGLRLTPDDLQLQKTGVALLLGRRRFAEALAKATQLNLKVPDDVTIYGYVAEADMELGNYPDADTAAQWMLNMRPNNTPGLMLGARLRVVYGDTPGALEFLNQAFGETPQIEPEEQAWIANQIADVSLDTGQLAAAAQALARAEEVFPRYPVTRVSAARLRMAQARPLEAIALLDQQLAADQAHHASQSRTLFLLARAQQQAGQSGSAETFARFEVIARAESTGPENDNEDLILYDAGLPGGTPRNPGEALRLAQHELTAKHDVKILDAAAWAFYSHGDYAEANATIQKALVFGIHSAQLDEHAGEIARAMNNSAQAAQNFVAAMQADPASPYAALAAQQLGVKAATQVAAVSPTQATAIASTKSTPAVPAIADSSMSVQLSRDTGGIPAGLLVPRPTGTARAIRKMQAAVEAHPADATGYAGLGAAFFQRARETGDVEDYQLAEQALTRSLDLVHSDLSATGAFQSMAEVCMGEHRFTDALTYAQKALALGSGDLSAYAIVGDAYADMGEYEKAGIAYSRLQPAVGGMPVDAREAYAQQTRTAYLTFVSGDTAGAIREMRTAIGEGVKAQVPGENLAWLYFELGEFSYQAGDIQQAADAYLTALHVYPGDYRALAGLGKVRANQGRYADAIVLYQSAIAIVPMPIYVSELGDIYVKSGNPAEAQKQYKLVEYIGLLGHINQVLHNRDLALFYADHDRNLEESLTLARKEFEVRSDIYTWDALAWALYKNGKYSEAQEAMPHALRLGTRDATLLFHAGMIASKLGHETEAAQQLQAAIEINPHFNLLYAEAAARELDAMHKQPAIAEGTATLEKARKDADAQ